MKRISTRNKVVAALLVMFAGAGFYLAQATQAANPSTPVVDSATPVIDKDFEVCLRKFVSKRFYNRIDATAEQRQKLDAIWTGTMDNTRPLREELRHNMLELSQLMSSDDATDEDIIAKQHQVRAVFEKLSDQRMESMLKARKVLTHEQRQKMHKRFSGFLSGQGGRCGRFGAFAGEEG